MQAPSTPQGSQSKKKKKKARTILLTLLKIALIVTAIFVAYINILPYERAVRFLLQGSEDSGFLQLIRMLPLIGAITSLIAGVISWLLGLALWAVIQILEILPIVLFNNEAFLGWFIAKNKGKVKHEADEEDGYVVRMAKRLYNQMPTKVVSNLMYWQLFAYVADFFICLFTYPPSESGIAGMFSALMAGNWGALDWGNLVRAAVMMFAMEVAIILVMQAEKVNEAIKEANAGA